MSFWSNRTSEPRRNFKFLLTIGDIPTWTIKSVNLPKISVGESEHKFLNHTFYFPGTTSYNTVSFTTVDVIDELITEKILASFANTGYNTPADQTRATEALITKNDAVRSLGRVRIDHLGSDEDGQNGKISFALNNAWVKDIEFASLDYGSEDLSEIKMELRYDFFTFVKQDGSKLAGFGS